MQTKAVLFDLGGTLWDDYPAELAYWTILAEEFSTEGRALTLSDFTALVPEVIATYCPDLSAGLLYRLAGADYQSAAAYQRARERIHARFDDPQQIRTLKLLYAGVHETLEELSKRYTLAVVSQHTVGMRRWLNAFDVAHHFTHIELTDCGLRKPDPRFYERALSALGVKAAEAVMVGDRLDNDIWPANCLGMRTVRVPSNPWSLQLPRYAADVPDVSVACFADLKDAI